jgi:hypothetical protein
MDDDLLVVLDGPHRTHQATGALAHGDKGVARDIVADLAARGLADAIGRNQFVYAPPSPPADPLVKVREIERELGEEQRQRREAEERARIARERLREVKRTPEPPGALGAPTIRKAPKPPVRPDSLGDELAAIASGTGEPAEAEVAEFRRLADEMGNAWSGDRQRLADECVRIHLELRKKGRSSDLADLMRGMIELGRSPDRPGGIDETLARYQAVREGGASHGEALDQLGGGSTR